MRLLFAVGLITLAAGCGDDAGSNKPRTIGTETTPPNKAQVVEQQTNSPKEEDGIGVDVWAEYKEDAKQADSKYKYKRTEVTGTIVQVSKMQEFPPAWVVRLKRKTEPGDFHCLIYVAGDGS